MIKCEYDWQMHFNPQKCFVMRLTHARHLTRFNYILGDNSLQETDNHPYLGVLKSQVVSLQTAHSWANAGVLLGGACIGSRVVFEAN